LKTLVALISLIISLQLYAIAARAYTPNEGREKVAADEMPPEFKDVGIEEQLGSDLNLSLPFKDESGNDVVLGDYFKSGKPVVISLVYFSCPGLCNFHLNGFVDTLKTLDWEVGKEFEYVVISFDSSEKPDVAAPKKENYVKSYGRPGSAKGWHFLTGSEEVVKEITSAVGFKYKWVEASKEWSHSSAAIIATPEGKLSRYLYGIQFTKQDVKLALNEAASGKIGGIVDRLILYCFQFDPSQNKYTLYAFNVMKAGAGLTLVFLSFWLVPVWFRQRKEKSSHS
jgi:protein SCO1/2